MEDELIKDFFNTVLSSKIEKEFINLIIQDLPEDETVEKLLTFILEKNKKLKSSKRENADD